MDSILVSIVSLNSLIELLCTGLCIWTGLCLTLVAVDVPAVLGVPRVSTSLPGQRILEGGDKIDHGPGDDHVVVGAQPERDHHCGHAGTCGNQEANEKTLPKNYIGLKSIKRVTVTKCRV